MAGNKQHLPIVIHYIDRWSLNLRHLQDMGFRMFYEHKAFRNSEVQMGLAAPHSSSERMEGIEEPPYVVHGEIYPSHNQWMGWKTGYLQPHSNLELFKF